MREGLMLKTIIFKEFREQVLTTKMAIAMGIILLAMIGNGLVFSLRYKRQNDQYRIEMNESKDDINKKASSLFTLTFHEQKLIKPPSRLAFLSEAEQNLLPNGMSLNYFEESQPRYFKAQNRFFERFQSIDWAFMLLYIVSFIAIAFSYHAFSGEKARGTLGLMMSNPVSRSRLILGKCIGNTAGITVPFLTGAALNLLILLLARSIQFSPSDIGFILLYLFLALLFIVFNVLLGLFMSSLTSRPVHSLNLVLIAWMLLCIIIPSVSWMYATKKIEVPSDAAIAERAEQQAREANKKGEYSWAWMSAWEGQPPNDLVKSRAEGIQVMYRVQQEVMRHYLQEKFRQTRLAISLSKISPFSVFRFLGERISDSGYYGYERFHDQARTYHSLFNDFIFRKDQQDPASFHLLWNESWACRTFMSVKPVETGDIPRFEYRPPSLREVLARSWTDITILILWIAVLFAGSFAAFMKYDVR